MNYLKVFIFLSFLPLLWNCRQQSVTSDTRENVLALFRDPPAEFRSMPLWVWNNRITEKQIEEQLTDFKEKGIGGVFVHPRPGLITPYLSEEWLSRFDYAVKTGKKLGMQVWIYDENSYPSGFAGGHVPAEMPESVGKMIRVYQTTRPDTLGKEFIKVFLRKNSRYLDVTQTRPWADGTYFAFSAEEGARSAWYGGYSYVDLMQRKVTEKFLEVTFNKGYDRFSAEYGQTIPGTFMDEPYLRTSGGRVLNYSPVLFDHFRKEHGYSLEDSLCSLIDETGNFRKIRYDYYATLLQLFISGWAEPYSEFCRKNNLLLTGHYWDHEWPVPSGVPDNMALTAYSDYPGIDLLMNQWNTASNGQFGNARMPKEIRSIANQLGMKRTFSETYGAAGWDLTFADQKRIADWEYALGVNFMNQHLSYVTIAGARKRDHPQSFSYHEPWWPQYRALADYTGRLSVALSKGVQQNKILVIEPTTTAWMHFAPSWSPQWEKPGGWNNSIINRISAQFSQLINDLEKWQVEYDLGCEDILRKHGKVESERMEHGKVGNGKMESRKMGNGKVGKLRVGNASYSLVILPEGLENLDLSTVELLERFVPKGGKVLSACGIPQYVNGTENKRIALLADEYPGQFIVAEHITQEKINQLCPPEILFEEVTAPTRFFHHRRELKNGKLIFLANSHQDSVVSGKITMKGKSVEKWDLFTGNTEPVSYTAAKNNLTTFFTLKPAESTLLFVSNRETGKSISEQTGSEVPIEMKPVVARRLEQNALTLDYCSIRLEKVKTGPLYFYQAQTLIFKQHGFNKNPWDNGVQFKSMLLDKDTFPENSGFEATYAFKINAGTETTGMRAVVERPEYFKVEVNGIPIDPIPAEWYLDKDFAVYDLAKLVKEGLNSLTLKVKPMRILAELEPVYLLGNFSLTSEKQGYSISPVTEIGTGSWKTSGMPMYSGKVSYSSTFNVDQSTNKKVIFKAGLWQGVVAELRVNDQSAGIVLNSGEEKEISGWIKPGENKIEFVVCGSLRNLLGPHHDSNVTGSTWPSMFWKSPHEGQPAGENYFTLDYGLMEPFEIKVIY